MWGLFFLTVAVVAVSLFLPGYTVLRGFGVTRCLSVSFAPLIGVGAYVLLGFAYEKAGVWSSWLTQAGVLLVLAAIIFAVLRLRRERSAARISFGLSDHGQVAERVSFDAACLVAFLLLGVVLAGVLFVWCLGTPDSYAQQFDNISHLGTIQGFVDSGVWSPFSSSLYASAADAAINPLPGGGFYPTAWYSVAALAVTSTGVSAACAENVANFVFVAFVLPSSAFGFMRVLFDGKRSVVPFGAPCTLLFAGFPWMLILFGPLYPNLSAFCMVPAVAAVFLLLFQKGCTRGQRIGLACLFVMAIISLALAQPNAVFTLAVLLAPFCIWQVSRVPEELMHVRGAVLAPLRVLFGGLALAVIAGIWMALYNAPFLASVVQHTWLPYADMFEAFQDALVCGFMADGSQVVLAALVVAGAVGTLWQRRYLWLSFSYAFACMIFVVNGYSDGPLKHIFGGFWYTDPWRCGAMASLIGIFLAAFGLWTSWRLVCWAVTRAKKVSLASGASVGVAACLAFLAVLGSTFPGVAAPGSQIGAIAFRSVLSGLHTEASAAEVYDSAEKAFVQQVKQTVPADALIINVPDDGSAFAFAADGLRTYFRYTREYDVSSETSESRIIRNSLRTIADNEYVQEAVGSIGAEYVLQLDQGEPDVESPHLFTYENGKKWRGIDGIRDDTPGFEVVLAEGDMRLYKITAA